ncbi:MAG: caspase family protein [Candidatus Marithrix sp.]
MLSIICKNGEFDTVVQEFEDKLRNYDVGLFYYSGHGLQEGGVNYLVPVDAKINSALDIKYVSVNASRVLEKMEYANKHTNLLILDACRDNPFKSTAKGFNKGLAEMSPRGSLIAFATAPKTTALDGLPTERNSIYTKHLLKQLRIQPHLSISDLLTQVAGGVAKETNQKQWPWKSDYLTDTFCFDSCSSNHVIKRKEVELVPSIDQIKQWWNINEPFSLDGLYKILLNGEIAYLSSVFFENRGRCCNSSIILVRPKLKEIKEIEGIMSHSIKVLDLNNDGTSEIEIDGSFTAQGYMGGRKHLININGWDVSHLRTVEYGNNFGAGCGENHVGRECYDINVKWSYKDLNNDGSMELIEYRTEKRGLKESDVTEKYSDNYFMLKDMKLIPYNP